MKTRIQIKNGIYELNVGDDLTGSALYNEDIAPTKITQRTWSAVNVASLWIGIVICIPTYTLGGVLTSYFGLSVKEALMTIFLANIIVLIPLCLNAFVGTKYGIPFPVVLRSSFGTVGSNLPCLIRAVVACGWFGIHTLFGGIAIHLLFSALFHNWASLGSMGEVVGFFIFLILNLWVVFRGATSIKWLETISAPLLLTVAAGLMFWALPKVDITAILSIPANRPAEASFWHYFFGALTAMVGFWAPISLNIPDFSRFVRSQKDQLIGQIIALPLTMFLFSALGVVLTAASPALVGETISDPINLIGKIDNPAWVALAMVLIIIATISTNTAANIVSPTNDFQNIAPKHINQNKGVLITGTTGILLMVWELLKKAGVIESSVSVETLYTGWLLGYSCLLGPVAGIMVADYFLIKRQQLNLIDLYRPDGIYPTVNAAGMLAFFIPVSLTLYSLITGNLSWFYNYGWFTGSGLGAALYFIFSRVPDSGDNSAWIKSNRKAPES